MLKKNITVLIYIIFTGALFANNYYSPTFNLQGHVQFSNNTPQTMRVSSGVSLSEDIYFMMDSLRPTIVYQLDLDTEMIRVLVRQGNHQITRPIYISFEDFLDNMFYVAFEREFGRVRIQQLSTRNRVDRQGLIPEIVLRLPPGSMPRTVRRIMGGSEAARLNISGSSRLTIGAGRSHRKSKLVSEWGGNTNFDVNIKQDLSIFVRGTIGEKISVSIRYNSDQESNIFDPNNVSVKYTGDEDEIVQSIDAGNISLSLPGSRHISSVGSSQGLFGVRSVLKLGDLNITAYMAKEESQKNTRTYKGTSQPDSSFVKSTQFTKRRMYYTIDPKRLFEFHQAGDPMPNGSPIPASWVDNAIKTDEFGQWLAYTDRLPDEFTLKVFKDSGSLTVGTQVGKLINPDGTPFEEKSGELNFLELFEGANADYLYDRDRGIIIFNTVVPPQNTIAIAYTTRGSDREPPVVVGNTTIVGEDDVLLLTPIKIGSQSPTTSTWDFELRNVYDLGMRNVRAEGFELEVFKYFDDQTRNYYTDDNMAIFEYLKMDTNGDNIIDGRDLTVDLSRGLIELPFLRPFFALGDEKMYTTDGNVSDDDFEHWFFIRGRIGRDSINLGMMILPGSVKITLNNREIRENIDYIVDYDLGTVSFLTAEGRDPDSEIQIDYENRPLFAIESRTMFGIRADWRPSNIFRLGGTFVYNSETMTDQRPRLGNEGRTLMMANVDGEVAVNAPIITTAIDYIPLVRTDEPSRLSLSGEFVMSMPRMQGSRDFGDGKEAWLDDMESIQEIYPLGIMRPTWFFASEPYGTNLVKGRTNWFNPTNIYYRDVYAPNTISSKERMEKLPVLSIKVHPPPIYSPGVSTPIWGGVMKFLGYNIDFSEREYIEFLVKVDSLDTRAAQVKMYLDLGDVSEDYYVENGGRGVLNTEDTTGDGILHVDEDVGFSGIAPGQPGHDPYDLFSITEINNEFPFINGTRGNGVLDTEDLNANGILDTLERFYRYQVTLGDTLTSFFQNEYNGWHLYRIPLKNNPLMQVLSNLPNSEPDLSAISFARMWFETESLTKVSLVYVDIVGNKWKEILPRVRGEDLFTETEVDYSTLNSNNTFISIETIDNHRSAKYTPPPRTTVRGTDGEISIEQSLMVNYNNIQPGQMSFARQRFRENFNLLSYNKLRYWVYLESAQEALFKPDSLNVILRLGVNFNQSPSQQSYYEILKPMPVHHFSTSMDIMNWEEIEVDFKDITILKTLSANPDTTMVIYTENNITYRLYNKPTLSNIRDVIIGVEVPNSEVVFTGTAYYNDIRVAEPNQNVGYIASATFDAKLADFATFRATYEFRTADFIGTTSRSTSNTSMDDRVSLRLNNDYELHKFFPVGWGIHFPLQLTYEHGVGTPRYKSNSDILREILPEDEKEREQNIDFSRSATSSIAMRRTPNSKIIAYTLRNLSLNANIREQHRLTATSADTTYHFRSTATYNLSIPEEYLKLKLWGNYYFQYLPKDYNNSVTYRQELPNRWRWAQNLETKEWEWQLPVSAIRNTKAIETSNTIRYDILSDLNMTYSLTTRRDLFYEYLFKGVNIGTEDSRTQRIEIPYNPFFLAKILPTNVRGNVNYQETRNVTTNYTTQIEDITYAGNVTRNIGVTTTIRNSDWLSSVANKLGASANRRYEANARKSGDVFEEDDKIDINNTIENNSRDLYDRDHEFNRGDPYDRDHDFNRGDPSGRMGTNPGREIPGRMDRDMMQQENMGRENEPASTDNTDDTRNQTPPKEKGPNTILADTFGILARVQNLALQYDNSYTSRYDKREEKPDFLYQLGIPNIIPDTDLLNRSTGDSFSASTGFPIVRSLVMDWRYQYSIQRNYTDQGLTGFNTTTRWPDVRVSLSGFERLIRADKILSSSRIQVGYQFEERLNFANKNWDSPQSETLSHNVNPLFGWTGNWANNITSTFTASLTYQETNTYSSTTTKKEVLTMRYSGTVGYSFTSEQPLKIPFTGRSINIRNQLSADLTVGYDTSEGRTVTTDNVNKDTDTSKLTITPSASYNFHRNMRGGLRGNYDINKNNIRGESTDTFRLDIWVEVTF